MTFISYAQNFEDVMLWRALKHVKNGFYIDVGANDPTELSVTRAFYDQGWCGINLEPVPLFYKKLFLERPRDITLNLAVRAKEGESTFYEIPNTALSTFDKTLANQHKISGLPVEEIKTQVQTLNQILDNHAKGLEIHFMNIDVEGSESEVLHGLDLSIWRPWIILIESTLPTTDIPDFQEWESLLTTNKYIFAYFDGLNRFYIAKEHSELEKHFNLPPNLFDRFVLARQVAEEEKIRQLDIELKHIQDNNQKMLDVLYALKINQSLQEENQKLLETVHILRSDNEAKENVIQDLNKEYEIVVENLSLVQTEKSSLTETVNVLNTQLIEKEQNIILKEQEIFAKENVIEDFRTSISFTLRHGPFRRIPTVLKIWQFFPWLKSVYKSWFRPHLGILYQHPPVTSSLPALYFRVKKLAKTAPKISIVTPSYNQSSFIERTIKSVIYQNYPQLEYIVQDGGSSDGTTELLRKFGHHLKHFESRQDHGQAHAINLGFQHATGEIMAYLNSDDILLPNTLMYVANYFAEHPKVDVIYGHRLIIDENDHVVGDWIMPPHDSETLKWADYIPQETLFWRRRIWEKVNGAMDESFQFALDWDLLLRFQEAGAIFKRLPRYLAAFRVHSKQKSIAQITEVGERDAAQLRLRTLGYEVKFGEILQKIKPFLRRSVWYTNFHKLKIRKDKWLTKWRGKNELVEWYQPESRYFFSLHKAGTALFTHVLRQADELMYVDYGTMVFDNQTPDEFLFHKYNHIYGIFRITAGRSSETIIKLTNRVADKKYVKDKMVIFLVRDPRDLLISQYYSLKYSHVSSSNPLIEKRLQNDRKNLESMDIDEYVLYRSKGLHQRFEKIHKISQVCKNKIFFRYEDLINNFDEFMLDFSKYISIPKERKQELFEASRPREDEDRSAHKRSGKVGQYKEKLKPETIEKLNKKFESVLEKFGYAID